MSLKKRKKIRLAGYDYSSEGAYFITVCVGCHQACLSRVSGHSDTPIVQQTRAGDIVSQVWRSLPNRFPNVMTDEFILMPDHIHGVLLLSNDLGKDCASVKLGNIIGAFKSLSTLSVNRSLNRSGSLWQRSYYDRVVRNERELEEIQTYIRENPLRLLLRQNQLLR